MLKAHKNIILGILIIVIIFFGYWYLVLSKKDTSLEKSQNTNLSNVTVSKDQTKSDQKFISNLQAIRSINLNVEILESQAFKALSFPEKPFEVNFNIPVSRKNPFLPIGQEARENKPILNQNTATNTPSVKISTSTPVTPIKKR